MEFNKFIDVIDSLAWPLCTLLFGVIFIFIFKNQIGNLISRVTSVGKEGMKAENFQDTQIDKDEKGLVEELMDVVGASPILKEVEDSIIIDLKEKNLDYSGDTNKILIRHLAATQIGLGFEKIYNMIFGSQIQLLKQLNDNLTQGVTREFIDGYFHNVQTMHKTYKEWEWETDKYMEYLIDYSLITIKGDRYYITVRGVEFLIWIIKNSRSEKKFL